MKISFLFSGQGTQFTGMGKDLEKNDIAYKNYRNAEEISGISIFKISKEGSQEELNLSQNTQLAIVTLQAAILDMLNEEGISSDATAGLSLGEYSALYNAKVYKFNELIELVKSRGEIMQSFSQENSGSKMLVVLGLETNQIDKYISDLKNDGYKIAVANYNCPLQQVVGGTSSAIEEFKKRATDAKRLLEISVPVPSHTPLMEPIVNDFKKEINKIEFQKLNQDFYSNISGKITDSSDVKDSLIEQLTNSTHMEEIITNMIQKGIKTFIEIGPKKVLSGFVKKIATKLEQDVLILNAFDLESTNSTIKTIKDMKNEK